MAFVDMYSELRGCVPKLSLTYARTLVNRAWREVREKNLWSFQIFEQAWISPPPITVGLATFRQGFNTIQFNATAIAAINASVIANPYAPVTIQQFRGGNVAGLTEIYNIIAYNPITGAATLDRIFADPSGVNVAYSIFQAYYTPQYKDFRGWISVRNMQMFLDLDLTKTKGWVDARDPQRSWYQFPTAVIPWGRDTRGQGTPTPSATLGYPMFELWGIAVTPFTYDCYGIRNGMPLMNPTDTLPEPIGEDLVLARARWYAYEWAEANKDMTPRAMGPDFKFLMGKANDDYTKLLTMYRKQDKEFIDNWFSRLEPDISSHAYGYYNTIAGYAGPYTQL